MAMATNLLKGQQSEWALTKRHKSEDIFGIQICGSKVEHVAKAAEILNKEVDVDFIDLNMGCPIDLVFKQGAGSALLDNRGRMLKLLRGMQEVTDIPITAKYRLGVRDNAPTCDRVVPKLDEMVSHKLLCLIC
jgi:tRNA-dihydrouridine synthase 3